MKVLWSTQAIQNMEEIYDFHVIINKTLATKIYNHILDEVKRLEKFPKLAALEPLLTHYNKGFRSLITKDGKYRVTYYIHGEKYVIIVSVTSCLQSPDIFINKFI